MPVTSEISSIRGLIAEAQLKRQDIAELLGYSESLFSLYINGRRPPPEGFEKNVRWAIERLKRANQAAEEARERVLSEDEEETREMVKADIP